MGEIPLKIFQKKKSPAMSRALKTFTHNFTAIFIHKLTFYPFVIYVK